MAETGSGATASPEARTIVARFRALFRRALYILGFGAAVLIVGAIALIALAPSTGPGLVAVLLVWFVLLAAMALLWYLNWRCPSCGSYLGGGFRGFLNVSRCPSCGARLI